MKKYSVAIGLCVSFLLAACSTTPKTVPQSVLTPRATPIQPAVGAPQAAIHTVQRGETLWRISQLYNVPVDLLRVTNKIAGTAINVGDKLVIPAAIGVGSAVGTAGEMAVTTIYPSSTPKKGSFIWPARGSIVTRFGATVDNVRTKGIEIATEQDAPIFASQSGRVSFVSDSVKGYGKMIIIDHSSSYQTVYAYNSANLATKGQRVNRGDTIARAGVSGRTQRPCLHFEIRRNHQPLNPESILS